MGKSAYESGWTPGELLSVRFLLASSILFVFIKFGRFAKISSQAKEWKAAAILGILGYALFSSCFFYALKGLSASLTVLLLYTYPIYVLMGSWFIFKENISVKKALAVPVAIFGLVVTTWGQFQVNDRLSLLFGIISAVLYAFYVLLSGRWLKTANPIVSTAAIQLFAGIFLGFLHLRLSSEIGDKLFASWSSVMLLVLVGTIAAMILFLSGLKKVSSWEASLLSITEPIVGVLVGVLFLKDQIGWQGYVGGLAILAALVWISIPEKHLSKTTT